MDEDDDERLEVARKRLAVAQQRLVTARSRGIQGLLVMAIALSLGVVQYKLKVRVNQTSAAFKETNREFNAVTDITSKLLLYDVMHGELNEMERLFRLMKWVYTTDIVIVVVQAGRVIAWKWEREK